jgi:hypothetical protein
MCLSCWRRLGDSVALIGCSLQELPHGQPPGFNPQAPRQSQPPPSRSLHDLHHPLYLQDPRIRPLAGSGTAVAGCAPPYCAIADGPELEKAWLFGRSSWPLSAPASPHASHHPLLSLAITQLASPNTLSRRQAKERFVGTQRHGLPFQVPAEPRIYLAESKFGPKHAPRLKRAARRRLGHPNRALCASATRCWSMYRRGPLLFWKASSWMKKRLNVFGLYLM